MADQSLCTACKKPANFFCLCTSLQTLLCPLCVASHISTRGAHLISPLSAQQFVKKAEDLDRYNLRLQVVSDLTVTLDSLTTSLEAEKRRASGVIRNMLEERLTVIRTAFEQAERDINSLYESIKTTIQTVRREVNEAVTVPTVLLSPESQLFIKSAAHLKERLETFLDIDSEINRRVSLSIQELTINPSQAFATILETKSCGSLNCFSCEEIRKALEIPKPQVMKSLPLLQEQEEEPSFFAKLLGTKVKTTAEDIFRQKTENPPKNRDFPLK